MFYRPKHAKPHPLKKRFQKTHIWIAGEIGEYLKWWCLLPSKILKGMIALGVKIIELHDRFWDSIDNYFDDCDFEDFLEGVKEDFYKAIIWLKNN